MQVVYQNQQDNFSRFGLNWWHSILLEQAGPPYILSDKLRMYINRLRMAKLYEINSTKSK